MDNMNKASENYLTGKCLVSMPNMADERFERSLIYICSHTKDGAMGFVVNKKIKEFSFTDLANQLPISTLKPITPIDLYQGGPLDKVRGFVLHSTDYLKGDSIIIGDGIAVSSSIDILTDIAFGTGPKDNLIALGYASWAPNQLEQEIINNTWLVAPSSPELVFRTKDEEKWQKALDSIVIDVTRLSEFAGRA